MTTAIKPFIILGTVWFAAMASMVTVAPLGEHPLLFSALFGLGHVLMILMVRWFPADLGRPKALAAILIMGIAARLVFIPYPVGGDTFRYVWEGYIQTQGFNPFAYAPDHPALADLVRDELLTIWQQINHPEFSAAYPPFSLLLFRMLARISPDPFLFKIMMIGFDIGVMIVLMLMLNRLGLSPSRLILYAANPLILVFTAGEGHLDVIQVFFLCLALYFIICKKYHVMGFFMLGMAIVTKYFALIALPFLVNTENRKKSPAVLIPLILYLPFIDAGAAIFKSLGTFAANFNYNDSLNFIIRFLFADLHLFVTAVLLIICLIWVYMFVQDALRSVYIALGCLLLFLPTLHPWYLVLILPFLSFFPSRAWLYLQAAVLFIFPVTAIELRTGSFQEIHWLKLLEYVPFYGLLVFGLFRDGYGFREKTFGASKNISVVIPSLNEADLMGQCLQSLQNRTGLKDIVVADGGSMDETREIAMQSGAVVVESSKGRGLQIEKGIKTTSADVILVMHADCEAKKGVFEKILKTLEENPHAVGGAIGMQFKQRKLRTRVVASLNNVRARLTGVSFGDQAQFFRMEALDAIGGFPSMMLMEDVELSLRLKEAGSLVFLSDGILVSGRRWQGNHFSYNLMTVFRLFPRYLIERRFRRTDRIYRRYYNIYYPDNRGFQ
jgi:rSAM/selenodomain-associated transferase 2